MKKGIIGPVLVVGMLFLLAFMPKQDVPAEDECACKIKDSLTQQDLLCMNSAAKIYSCLNDVDIEPEEVFSCEWYLYTGEETIMRRYDKDEMPLVIKNNILMAKELWIRGIRKQDEAGKPTDVYLRKRAKIKFKTHKVTPN